MPDEPPTNALAVTLHREAVKLTKEYGIFTLRLCMIINGGAILAVLTLLGSLLSHGPQSPTVKLAEFVAPFRFFGLGLVTAVIAAACGYFNFLNSQMGLGALTSAHDAILGAAGFAHYAKKAKLYMYAAHILTIISIASFVVGAAIVSFIFSHY